MKDPMKVLNPRLGEEELDRLRSVMDMGAVLARGAPKAIIDWNKAIDEEQRKKRSSE